MKRNFDLINKSFPEFGNLAGVQKSAPEVVKAVSSQSDADLIFDAIYAPDPNTLLPIGSYAMLMSDKCSPEIRDFIKSQLMVPHPAVESTSDVPDSVLMELTRGTHETLQEYMQRVSQYAEDNKLLYYKELKLQQQQQSETSNEK